jgi:hypothetical protein
MTDFHAYERTRKRQAKAILWMAVVPSLALGAALIYQAAAFRPLVFTLPVTIVGLYGAWDLSRVVVDPATMHVEAIDVGVRRAIFARTAALMGGVVAVSAVVALWVQAFAVLATVLGVSLLVLVVQGVHLAVTDTRLAPGAAEGGSSRRDAIPDAKNEVRGLPSV